MAHAESPETDEIRLFAASLAHDPDGIELPYLVLDHVATRHRLVDAVLVLRAGPLGIQLFSRGRGPVAADEAGQFVGRPIGLYTVPDSLEPTVRAALAGICNIALTTQAVRQAEAVDEPSGLSSRSVIDASLVRATACGARYGWTSTAVLLATGGEGSAAERWTALSRALRMAARMGDEVGVAAPGRALALLGNAGPDVVRPFVARVRAALSAAGDEAVDLHAATVTTPLETVDPEAVWSLLTERLDEVCGATGRDDERAEGGIASRAAVVPADLELALRSLPGVVSVGPAPHPSGVGYQIEVVAMSPSETLGVVASRRAREQRVDAPVVIVAVGDDRTDAGPHHPDPWTSRPPGGPPMWATNGSSENGTAKAARFTVEPLAAPATSVPGSPGAGAGAEPAVPGPVAPAADGPAPTASPRTPEAPSSTPAPAPPPPPAPYRTPPSLRSVPAPAPPATAITSLTAPATAPAPAGAAGSDPAAAAHRVTLIRATFDMASGVSEVHLTRDGVLGVGLATVGPLAGGAQATLSALGKLGVRIPYYLVSAERAHSVPGEPVVVVLAPRAASDPSEPDLPLAERIGIATGTDDVGASARSTLSALNRFLGGAGPSER